MHQKYNSRLLQITGLILGVLVWLANASNPPTGRTGAPFDGHCNNCHTGNVNGFDGSVVVDGLPSTIESNTTYPLMITLTPTAGSPVRGGYQLVVVDGNNVNAGDLTAGNAQSGTEFFGGREYLEHRGAKNFTGGGPATWNFNWKSPVTASGNTIKFYFIGNFTNGNNNDSGDYPIAFLETYSFNGPPPVTASITSSTNVSCFGGNNGSATVEPDGGLAPYSYSWSNGQTTQTAINLMAGTYFVTVTGSGGTGTASTSVVITQPTVLNATASVSGVLTCVNTSVTATVSASGGTPPYMYNWSNGDSGPTAQLTMPGSNSVTTTDDNGCTKVSLVNVTSNLVSPVANAGPAATLTCANPTAILNGSASSNGAGFAYAWVASAGGNIVSGANTLTPVINAPGTYTLTVTNNGNGCTAASSTTASSTAQPPTATASASGMLTCTNTTTTVTVTTNASPAGYSWAGPSGFTSTSQTPTVSLPGVYTVTVTNTGSGCSSTATTTVSQNTTPPSATAANSGTLTCTTTSITLNGSSTTTGAGYAWAGPNNYSSTQQNPAVGVPGTYTLTVTNPANGCTATATTTVNQNITAPSAVTTGGVLNCTVTSTQVSVTTNAGTPAFAWTGPGGFSSTLQSPTVSVAGPYNVIVTDNSNGCTATAVATVTQNITPPVASVATPANLNCTTTSTQLNATASSQGANFTYLWTTTNGNIVSGATTLTPTVNAGGTYCLLVTNSNNGCTASTCSTVNQSPPVGVSVGNVVNVSCNGGANGSLTATGTGGTGTYTYLWSSSAGTATAGNLTAGTYVVTATDSENCTATATAVVTQPAQLSANVSVTAETAAGAADGTATAAPTGGTPAYNYLWNTSATTPTITGLAPGSYTVIVTDMNNCTAVQTVTVNSFNCTLSAAISATNITCNGLNNGTATVSVSGAAMPVTYQWSNGDTTPTADNLPPGTFTVIVTDANNCPAQLSVSITQPSSLVANASATNQTGIGQNDGTATAQPTGGTASYSYLWSNGGMTQMITGLAPGTYTVSVTDANNCLAIQAVVVSAFNCALSATVSVVSVSCAGGSDGQATAVPAGGTLPVTYAWSNSSTAATATNLPAGTYTVTLTDGAGCVTTAMASIVEPPALQTSVGSVQHVVCPEDKTGSAVVTASGGTAPYDISWPGGSNGMNLGVGIYIVSVTDANGCSATNSVTIESKDNVAPQITCSPAVNACPDKPLSFQGPTVSDNCNLNGATAVLISGLPSGSIFPVGETVQEYRITDASGNTASCSFTITVSAPIEIKLDSSTPDVDNAGVGSIQVTVSGDGVGYTFEWKKDGVVVAQTEDLTGLTAGVYTLTVTGPTGCTFSLAPVTIDNTVDTYEPDQLPLIRVIPNPASQLIRLEMSHTEPVAAHIINLHGQLIRVLKTTELHDAIDISTLPEGWYGISVLTEKGTWILVKWMKID